MIKLSFRVVHQNLSPVHRIRLCLERENTHPHPRSKDDDDGSENVGEKMSSRSFKLNRSIWTRSKYQMQATFPGVEFLRILFRFKKRKENSSSHVHVLHKTAIRRFHVVVVQWTSKKCTKKRDARAELLFLSLNLLLF